LRRCREDKGAGPRFQHVGKIFRDHHRRDLIVDALAACDLPRDRSGKRRLAFVVAGTG